MNIKEFFKPTIGKITFFLFLIIVTSIPSNILVYGADIGLNYGFPFNFYGYGGGLELLPGEAVRSYLNIQNFVIDILIWYLVVCLIIFIYNKLKKKDRK